VLVTACRDCLHRPRWADFGLTIAREDTGAVQAEDHPHEHPHTPTGGWQDPVQVRWYLDRVGQLPPRLAGEAALRDLLPPAPTSVLDLGCGDGRLADLVLDARPSVTKVVAVDLSPPMLDKARERFAGDARVEVRSWDLREDLAPLGSFDLIVSGFAIHHLDDSRKQTLLIEAAGQLLPGGVFANLEIVASATPTLHAEFLATIGRTADDLEDQLVDVESQLTWMRDAGLADVDCMWRWRGMALLMGRAGRS
jgi:SAM-dependent methyltransferase